MIHAAIRFERAGLDDDAPTRARNVNGFAGFNCANWLKQSVDGLDGARVRGEPVPEDWGWALVVDVGKHAFVLGCGSDPDNDGGWQVLIGDNVMRGIMPWTRRRRTAALQVLTAHVDAFLRAQGDVANIKTDAS
jgi:hypothetical protein